MALVLRELVLLIEHHPAMKATILRADGNGAFSLKPASLAVVVHYMHRLEWQPAGISQLDWTLDSRFVPELI